jgi:hypothetical protein
MASWQGRSTIRIAEVTMPDVARRSTRPAMCVAFLSSLLLPGAAAAQAAVVREVLSVRASLWQMEASSLQLPAPLVPQTPAKPGHVRVAAGTVGGGLLGAAGGALIGAGLGTDDGFISTRLAFATLGAGAGYTIGSAMGAQRAASSAGMMPPLPRLLLTSVLSSAVGGVLVWQIAEIGDDSPSPGRLFGAMGGAALLHAGSVTIVARNSARTPRR